MTDTFASALDILISDTISPADLRALNDELFEVATSLKKHMDQGLAPDDMKRARGLWEAAEAARLTVAEMMPG